MVEKARTDSSRKIAFYTRTSALDLPRIVNPGNLRRGALPLRVWRARCGGLFAALQRWGMTLA